MAHTAQPAGPPHRTREIVIGVLAIVIAIPVIIVLILALRHPNGRRAIDAGTGASGSNGASVAAPVTGTSGSSTTTPKLSSTTNPPPPVTTSASTQPTTKPTTPTSASSSAPVAGRLPIIVLNNTAAAGSTALAISRFQAGGWTATDGGAFQGDILSTAAYYDPDADGSKAAALALQQQFPAIQRVVPAFTGLPSGPVVVVLTSDYH